MTSHLRRRRVSPRLACSLFAAALAYGCGGGSDAPTTPGNSGPIRVIAGAGQTDTVLATLPRALVVEIRDSTSRIVRGVAVHFSRIWSGPGRPFVSILRIPQPFTFDAIAFDTTDAQGRASTTVQNGTVAGTGLLEISVPQLGLFDTVAYTITPGAPARVVISPSDTSIAVLASYTARAVTTDQFNNPIAGATPTFSGLGITVSPSGQITAPNVPVRGRVLAYYRQLIGGADVSVVPRLPMVINRSGTLVLINSDGSGATTTLATSPNSSLSPSSVPATPNVVFYQGDPSAGSRLWVVQPNGTPRALLAASTHGDAWPRLSPDGTWVYFVRDQYQLWRVRIDGTGLDSLTTFVYPRIYEAPTVSPDGKSVAIEDGRGIQIVDVATKASRTTPWPCPYPRYSPDGAQFACMNATTIWVVGIDGSAPRTVAQLDANTLVDDLSGVDWSPDGKWLLVTMEDMVTRAGAGTMLIDVVTGARLPLSGLGSNYIQAAFVR